MKKEYIKCEECLANYLNGNLHICDPLMKRLVEHKRAKETMKTFELKIGEVLIKETLEDRFNRFFPNGLWTKWGAVEPSEDDRVIEFANEAFSSQKQELRERVNRKKRYDPWAHGFNIDKTNGYNEAIDDVIKLLK